jgi:hypothetical protein
MDKKKHIITMSSIIIIVAGGMFYAGMKYSDSKVVAARMTLRGNGDRMDVGPAGGGTRGQRGGVQGGSNSANGEGFSGGQVVAKDDTSITIKTRDGGSKIVYYSGATSVGKTVSGSASELNVGQDVMVSGKSNPDGSIAAKDIQIRPEQNQ